MPTVVDTVVLHYFLVVGQVELLMELLDPPVGVPRIVFDPKDAEGLDGLVSELRQNIRYEERIARSRVPRDGDDAAPELEESRKTAEERAEKLSAVEDLVRTGRVEILDLTEPEFDLVDRLTARIPDASLGLVLPLDEGEAACVAMAFERGWVLATDDGDALRVLNNLASGHEYERIRRLLVRAATSGLETKSDANEIHQQMREAGFWDDSLPFGD